MSKLPITSKLVKDCANMSAFEVPIAMVSKVSELEQQLEDANKVIEFYGDVVNWSEYIFDEYQNSSEIKEKDLWDKGSNEYAHKVFVGGKRAKQYLIKYGVRDDT